jgi:hypothetical protein
MALIQLLKSVEEQQSESIPKLGVNLSATIAGSAVLPYGSRDESVSNGLLTRELVPATDGFRLLS